MQEHESGCPTLRGFRSVGTTDLNSKIPRLKRDSAPTLDAISTNAHPSKTATNGAASVVVAQGNPLKVVASSVHSIDRLLPRTNPTYR